MATLLLFPHPPRRLPRRLLNDAWWLAPAGKRAAGIVVAFPSRRTVGPDGVPPFPPPTADGPPDADH